MVGLYDIIRYLSVYSRPQSRINDDDDVDVDDQSQLGPTMDWDSVHVGRRRETATNKSIEPITWNLIFRSEFASVQVKVGEIERERERERKEM